MPTLRDFDGMAENDTLFHFGKDLYDQSECGIWIQVILDNGDHVYYESQEGRTFDIDDPFLFMEVGCIIEGEQGEIGPLIASTKDELREAIKTVENLVEEHINTQE